ncbi:protein SAR DEFICIENT 1-like [Mangifera indica]|uniref:protein SAR DEFICIENT 1-like n=1 Tax=Mangifera indica TaxID=29780 RepID=UPI001CFB7A72|nr:protein SAR DEFICIENT 1-like [Mangifera indica]
MAAKRVFNESRSDPDQPPEKKPRTRPSFASVIGEVVMVNSMKNLFSAIEPMVRRVVKEEVERAVRQSFLSLTSSPSLSIQALEPSSLKLIFSKNLSLPIFTGSKITDAENNPLQVVLVDTRGGGHMVVANLPHPIKVDIVVLDGDFAPGEGDNWTSEEFDSKIVKERTGKRPLLTGDVSNINMRDGLAAIGDIEFTDNSSWIRSRKFRIGVKVAAGNSQGIRIREAITEAFVVKDHRGELYKKHHPPMLQDEVWRLEKIGKDGVFHRRLSSCGIKSVQDFLKLSTVDQPKLKRILGAGMSEKMWEVTLKHARTCVKGNKFHIYRGNNCTVILNPICQVVKAVINGQTYSAGELSTLSSAYIERMVRDAYANWHSLEEVEGSLNEPALLLTQGELVDEYPSNNLAMGRPVQQNSFSDRAFDIGYIPSNLHPGGNDWQIQTTYLSSSIDPPTGFTISESSSDGDPTTSSRTFLHGN